MATVLDDEADPFLDVLNSTAKTLFLRSELTVTTAGSEAHFKFGTLYMKYTLHEV